MNVKLGGRKADGKNKEKGKREKAKGKMKH